MEAKTGIQLLTIKDTTLKMSGTYTDATSGIDTLFYYIQYPGRSGQVPADLTAKVNGNIVADGEVSLKANSADSTQYDFNFTVVDYKNNAETPNTLYIQTIDNAGNKSDVKAFTINIDTSAPELTALYYKVGEGTIKEAGGTVYVNGTLPITVYGNYKDAESGAEPLTGFKINGTSIAADVSYSASAISSTTDIPASFASYSSADSKAIRSWKAVFTPAMDGKFEFEGRNGTYDESVSLTGGKTAVNPFKITLDTTGPSISNVSITPSNNTVAYKKTESNGTVNYYVNNQAGTTFTFAGVSADSTGVDTVKLEVFNSDNTKIYSETTSHSEWSFADVALSALTGTQSAPSKATITVTDIAGNSTTQELRLVFDTTAPKAMHWADANNKDIYFRIGSDTGSKYSYGSWGNDSTIEIRGTFDEASAGSGLKAIHYAIFDAVPTSEQISAFEAGTLTVTGSAKIISSFAPLSTADTQTVSYSTNTSGGRASKTVTTNFRTTLSGFNGQNNYLVLVAEDNVGNRAADTLAVNDGSTEGTNSWNSNAAYYSINKDTQAPSITSNATNLYTNGTGSDIIISGTASDALSGLANVTVTIEEINFSREITEFTGTAGNEWSTTIPVSNFAADTVSNGKTYTVYAKATDNAGVGNSKQISAGTIVVDKKAPAVKISSSSSVTKDKVTFSGTVNDGTGAGLASSNMILYYTKSSTLGGVTEAPTTLTTGTSATDAETKWVQLATIAPSTDWSLADVDLTEITGGDANTTLYFTIAAKDAAGTGNTGYAKPCSLLVDRNKPVLSDASSGIGTKLGAANVNNVWFNSKTLKLSGAYTDEGGSGVTTISYQINTAAKKDIQTTDGSYDVNISDFVDGSNTVTIWAKDKVGIESEHTTYTFNIDSVVPVIASIDGAETTKTTDVALTINITDKNPVAPTVVVKAANQTEVLKILTASVPAGSDSAYTSTVTIPFASELTDDGFYDIEVTVKDKADNTSTVFTKRIVRDQIPPTITITKPASESGAFIKSTNYKFEGTITDATCGIQTATAALYKISGTTESKVGETEDISLDASGNWVFQAYELEVADYKVKINATDIAGNAAVEIESAIVKIDSVPPKVTVTSTGLNDSTGSAVNNNPLSNGITYYANGNYSIKVKVEDLNYLYADAGTYSGLTEITANDNSSEDLSLTKNASIDGSGNTVITINPSAYTDGLFTYTIKVWDKAGNKADDVIIKVHRDTTGPSVEIKNPASNITDPKKSLDANSYSFRINANDGSGVGVSNLYYLFSRSATAPAASSESSWVKETFTDGDKIIEMNFAAGKSAQTTVAKTELCEGKWYLHSWAKDKSGNASTVSTRTFSIDKAAPVLSVTQALNEGSRNVITVGSTGYALSGTVSDSNELAALVLKVDGVDTTITPASGTTVWSTTLSDGQLKSDESVEVELTATDIAGKTTTKKFTLYNDTKNPELEITAPVLNEPVATLGKVIKGTASDDGYGIDKVEYKLFSGEITSSTESDATVVTSSDKQVTSADFPVEIKGEQWYIKDSTNGMPLGTKEGSLTLKVTAIEKKNGTYGGRSISKYVPFYFDKANPELKENVINTAGKTTKDGFTLGGKVWDSNAIASLTIKCGNKTWVSGTDSNITITPTTSEPEENNWTATFVVGTTNNNANNYVADGINEFTIIATDSAGKTTQITRTVTVDTQKPEIGTVSFTNQGTVTLDGVIWYKTTSIPVTVPVTEHGLSGISKVEYSIQTGDSVTWSPLSNDGTNYTGTINFAGNGNQTLRLKATDVAGNVSEEITASVNIDTSAPDLSALYYKKGTTGTAEEISSPVYLKSGTQITVYGNYKDEQSGVENLTFKIGNEDVTPTVTYSTTEIGNGVATIPSDYVAFASISDKANIKSWKAVITPTANGQFTVTGKNRTQIQTSAVGIFTIAIDGTAPTVSIINPAIGTDPINGTNYTFRINADDGDGVGVTKLLYAFGTTSTAPVATTWYEIDFTGGDKNIDMPLVTGKSPVYTNGKVSSICEGDWYVFAKAIDKAGNETATAVSRAFTVDRSNPNLTVSGLNESGVNALYKEISNNKYVISGTASDTNALAATNAVTLSIDGQTPVSATVSGTSWTYDLTAEQLKADELVSVKVTAKDVTGKTTEKEYTLYYDTKDPELEVTAPVDDEAVETDTKVIKGTVSDGGYGIKKLEYKLYRGTALIASGDTEHSDTDYPLTIKGEQWYISKNDGKLYLGSTEGELTLEVTATENKPDGATASGARKYVTTKTVNFYYDSANPEVTESEVGSTGKTTNGGAENKFSLVGTASDLNALESVTINWKVGTTNKTITLTPTASQLKSMNWSQEFVVGSTNSSVANYVADGTNEFTIIAKDITGKTKQITRTVTVDTGNPSITMPSVSPESTNGWYNTRTLTVSGAASDEGTGIAKVEYSFDENTWIPLLVSGTNYSGSIMFDSDGTGKQITVKATDVAGNTDTKKIENIQIDSERPSISSIDGAETIKTTDVELTINITDKNPVAPTVEVKAANSTTVLKTPTASIPTGSDSTYTSTVTIPFASELTTDGFYDIEVTVNDKAGNTSAKFTKRIVRDHVAPTITITKPASESGAFIKATNYKFEGTITDATCGIQTATAALFKVTGSTEEQVGETEEISLDASGNWVFQAYELEAADYKVKINAADIAGNAATETESSIVKIDSVPPKVTVSSTGLNDSTGNNVGPLSNGLTYYAKGNYSIVVSVDDINFDYSYIKPGTSAGKLYEVTGTDRNSTTQALTITSSSAKAFTIVPSSVSDGLFTYTIKVEDKAGNKADDVIIKVHRDITGPSVEIRNPGVNITDPKNSLDADTYSFRINANDGSGVGVSNLYYLFSTSSTVPETNNESAWDGGAFTDGDKIIEMDLEDNKDAQTSVKKTKLCEGTWYLHSWAKDKSGNASTVSTRTFSIDKAAPVLSVTQALNEGSRNVITVGSTGYALSGTVSDSNELASLVLKVDGESSTITPSSGTTVWSTTLSDGQLKSDESVEVELTATDIAGKTTTKKFTLYNDTKNPELEITAPVLNEPVATLGKVIKGTSSDDGYGIDKVEYKLFSGVVTSDNESTATVVTSEDKDVTSENFQLERKGEQWYIKDSTNGMPLGTTEGQLTLKVTATEKTNGTYGGRSTSKYVPFYFDKANPNLEETGIGTTGKTTNTTFSLSGTASDSNALQSVTINWKVGETDKSVTLNPTTENWSQEFVVGTANSSANNYVEDGANEFTIIATDITGKTKQLTRTVTVDTQEPTVGDITVTTTGTAVGTATWYKTSNIEVTVAVTENGLSGISKVEYQAEDGTWTPLSFINNKYQGTIRFTGDGAKTFNIKATDVAGNVSEEATASVNIDTSAPELSALYFKKGTGAAQSITSPVYLQSNTQITVYGNYKDEQSGVKALAFKLGSASLTPTVNYSTTAIGTSAPSDDSYTIESDEISGNETTIRSWKAVFTPSASGAFVVTGDNRTTNPTSGIKIFDITIDDTAPTVQIKTPAADITDGKNALNGENYSFSVNASDGSGVGVTSLQYAFSKNSTSPAATEWETIEFAGGDKSIEMPLIGGTTETRTSEKVTELCEGTWYLYVKATDKSGNVNTTPVKRTFKVDMAAPTLTIPSTIQEGKRNVISSEVGTNGYVLSGTVSDTNALTSLVLKVDNVETTITPASGTAWTATIAKGTTDGKLKSDEAVEVELIATDIAGKTTTKNFILYYDIKAPELEITAPVADEPVETAEKVIKGTVSDDGYGIDKVEYKLYSGVVTSANEATATIVTSNEKQVTSTNFPVEIKGEQWYIKTSTGMPLGTAEGSLTLKVTATEKKNGTYGGRSTSKYVSFYFDKANPNLDETGIGSAGKTTNTGFTLGGKVWDSNAIASLTIKCGNKTWGSGTDSNITINPTTSEPTANNWTATFVVGSANSSADNYVADGTNEFTIIAKDISGKEKQLTRTVIVDTVAPTCGTPSITSTGKEVGTGTDAKTWYNTSFINIKLENVKDDGGTGISKVEYTTETGDSAKWYPMSGSKTTYTATVNCISQGENSIRVKVTDVAGNEEIAGTLTAYIDTKAPTLSTSKVKYLNGDFAAVSELLINASNGYQLQIEASDAADETAANNSGVASVTYFFGSQTIAGKKSGNYWIIEVETTGNGTNNYSSTNPNVIYVEITDNAGNTIKERILSVTKDTLPPTVEFTSPEENAEINKTIEVKGKATDINEVVKITLTAECGDNTKQYIYEKGATGNSLTFEGDIWSANVNTLDLDSTFNTAGNTVTFTVKAEDIAGNECDDSSITYKINQHGDRPVITIGSGVDFTKKNNNEIWVKGSSTIYGSVNDDDGISTFKIYKKGSKDTDFSDAKASYSGGSWNVKLPKDDSYILKFEVKDKGQFVDSNDGILKPTGTSFTSAAITSSSSDEDILETPIIEDAPEATEQVPNPTPNKFGNTKANGNTLIPICLDTTNPSLIINAISLDNSTWYEDINKSDLYFGGDNDTLYLKVTASDTSGLYGTTDTSGISAEFSGTMTVGDDEYELQCPANACTVAKGSGDNEFIITVTNFSTAKKDDTEKPFSGTMTLTVTAKDKAEMETQKSLSRTIDNAAPVLKISAPDSVSSTAVVSGTVEGEVVNPKIYFAVTKAAATGQLPSSLQPAKDSTLWKQDKFASLAYNIYFDGTTSDTTTHTDLFRQYLVTTGYTTSEALKNNTYKDLTPVYVWIKAEDVCGNISYDYATVVVDPQGNRPNVVVSYPNENGVKLGGTIRLMGTANDNVEAKFAWIKLDVNGDGKWTKDDYDILAAATHSGYVFGQISTNKKIGTGEGEVNITPSESNISDIAIMAKVTGGSWNQNINADGELIPSGDKNNTVTMWVSATDDDNGNGTSILESSPVARTFIVDKDNPYFVQDSLKLITESGSEQAYKEGMNVKGEWWLVGTIKDDVPGIRIISVTEKNAEGKEVETKYITTSGQSLTTGNYQFTPVENKVKNETTGVEYTYYNYNFKIKVGATTGTGEKSFKITATEDKDSNALQSPKDFIIRYDNLPPTVASHTSESFKIDKTVKNSQGYYSLSSAAYESNDGDTGVERIAVFFTRTIGETTYVFDPMYKRGFTPAGGSDVSKLITGSGINLNSDDGLYWGSATATSISSTTLTLSENAASYVHVGGLAKVKGVVYRIDSVSGSTVVLENEPGDSTNTTVYFAVANVVDNTDPESKDTENDTPNSAYKSDTGFGYGYCDKYVYDDGDKIIENLHKDDTKSWTWELYVNSKNIPDGDVDIHYVVFDKAGNFKHDVVTGASVENNKPRLVSVALGVDINQDGNITQDANEITNYYPEGLTERPGVYTNASTAINISGITVKGKMSVTPEIVGGNGDLFYQWQTKKTTTWQKVQGTGNELMSGNNDYDDADFNNANDYIAQNATALTTQTGTISHDIAWLIENSTDNDTDFNINYEIFDSTDGKTPFATDSTASNKVSINITGINLQVRDKLPPAVTIDDFYWNSLTDNSVYTSKAANQVKSVADLEGHIELGTELPADTFKSTNATDAEHDRDDKVSGKIKVEGTASDNRVLTSLYISIPGMTGTTTTGTIKFAGVELPTVTVDEVTYYKVASYDKSSKAWKNAAGTADFAPVGSLADNGFVFTVLTNTNSFDIDDGHSVDWQLLWDSAKLSNVVQTNVGIKVLAYDDAENAGADANSSGIYTRTIDVVPYITDISTGDMDAGTKKFLRRSASGAFVARKGDTTNANVTISGYNLNGAKVYLGDTQITTTDGTDLTVAKSTLTKSGTVKVRKTVNSVNIESLNNVNNDTKEYNKEPAQYAPNLTDNRNIYMWNTTTTAYSGTEAVMKPVINNQGAKTGAMKWYYANNNQYLYADNTQLTTSWAGAIYGGNFAYNSSGSPSWIFLHNMNWASGSTDYVAYGSVQWAKGFQNMGAATAWNRNRVNLAYPHLGLGNLSFGSNTQAYSYNNAVMKRYENLKLIVSGNNTDTLNMVAYFDKADESRSIVFWRFHEGTGITSKEQRQTDASYTDMSRFVEETYAYNATYGYTSVGLDTPAGREEITTAKSGADSNYFDMAYDSVKNVVYIAYYDEVAGGLKIRYLNDPASGYYGHWTNTWATAVEINPDAAGQYVSMKTDGSGNVHLAYYDSTGSYLKYAMLTPAGNSGAITGLTVSKKVLVDTLFTNGMYNSITLRQFGTNDVRPVITSYSISYGGTKYSLRTSWPLTPVADIQAGANDDGYTGKWETVVVVSANAPKQDNTYTETKGTGYTGNIVVGYTASKLEQAELLF